MARRTCDRCGALMPPHYPRKRIGNEQVCEGCYQWSPKTGALHNPTGEIQGHPSEEWYHGSPNSFEEFHDPMESYPLATKRDPQNRKHWNTLLGNHFSAQHEVANQFTQGSHGNVAHVKLHIRRPKTYRSEHDMDQEAYEMERARGNHIDNYLDEIQQGYKTPALAYRGDSTKHYSPTDRDEGYYGEHFEFHPAASGWLNSHPDKYNIARRFKEHLKNQGYDGIVYGNEFEEHGDKGEKSLPIDPSPFPRSHVEEYGHPPLDMPEVAEHNRNVPQRSISAIAFEPRQIEVTQHHVGYEDKTPEEMEDEKHRDVLPPLHTPYRQPYLPGMDDLHHEGVRTASTAEEYARQDLHRGLSLEIDPEDLVDAHRQGGTQAVHQYLRDRINEKGGLGTHWTSDPKIAHQFSQGSDFNGDRESVPHTKIPYINTMYVPVMMTGTVSPEHHETDPRALESAMVQGHGWQPLKTDRPHERETLIKPGAPVHVSKIQAALPSHPDWISRLGQSLGDWEHENWGHGNVLEHSWQDIGGSGRHTASSAEEYARQDAGKQDVWQTTTEGRTLPLCQYHRDAALGRDRAANSLGAYYDLGQSASGAVSGPEKGSCAHCNSNTDYILKGLNRGVSRHKDSAQPRRRRQPYMPTQTKPFTPVIQSTSSWDDDEEEPRECEACGEIHPDIQKTYAHEEAFTDWDHRYGDLNSTIHRGIRMDLPQGHEGHAAAQHILAQLKGKSLGVHWTDQRGVAEDFGEYAGSPGNTDVLIHAHKPRRHQIEEDLNILARNNVFGYDVSDEAEVPLKKNAPVRVSGISWRSSGDENGKWKHHNLKEPMEMTAMRKQAHDATENQDVRHCCFCGSGKIIGRADGSIECEFCHNYFTVQVQPQYPNFPQTMNGVGTPPPGMPGQVEQPSMEDGAPGEDEDAPPWASDDAEGDAEEGLPSDMDKGGDNVTDEDSAGNDDSSPPFAKQSFRTVTGARLTEDQYVRHLAINLASDPQQMAARIKAERR